MLSNHMHRVQLGGAGKNSYLISSIKIDATSNTIDTIIARNLEDIS